MRTDVVVSPPQGPRAPDTQALCTMSQPTSDIFPLEQLPAPREGEESDGLTPGLISLFILLRSSPPCSFKPKPHSAGPCPPREKGHRALSSAPSHRGLFPSRVSHLLFPSRKESGPPSGPPLGEAWQPSSPPPVPVLPGQGWDPWLHPSEYYIALVSVCVCVGVRVHVPPFKEQTCTWSLRQGVVCAGGEGPSVWCYPCLLCPWVSACGCFPHAHTPCSVTPAALHPQAGGQSCW